MNCGIGFFFILFVIIPGTLAFPALALDDNPYHQLPATEGKISFFASDDRDGTCDQAAFGELLGENCGNTDATKYWYVAMRWPYNTLSGSDLYTEKEWWHNKKILITNPANGKQVILAAKDWGPAEWTGRVVDVSKTAIDTLGMQTDQVVKIEFADQNSELGVVESVTSDTLCKIPVFDQTKYSQRLGTCNGCTISSDGCIVTSLAMALVYYGKTVAVPAEHSNTGSEQFGMDPAILNDWLTWKEGYNTNTDPKGCPGECLMNWKAVPGGIPTSNQQYNPKTDGISEDTYQFIDNALANGNLIIAGVHWGNNKKEDSHYILITKRIGNTYAIIDPYGGKETTLDKGIFGSYIIDHYRSINGEKAQCSQVSWDFNTPGDLEGWEHHNVEAYSVEGGRYFIDPGLDPWIQSPLIMADANSFHTVEFNMSSNAPDNIGTIYFTTIDSPEYTEDKKIVFTVNTGPQWSSYRVYMAGHSNWKGLITGIRLDPATDGIVGTNTDTIGFDNIKLGYGNPIILDQSIYPNNPKSGEKLDFVYKIENPFSNPIENVRLGARIRTIEPQGDWIDDWDRDEVVTLTTGIKDYSRSFEKTYDLNPGYYDAQWVLLNHETGTWLDHENMVKILQVIESPTGTPTPDYTPTPGNTPQPTTPVHPIQSIVGEMLTDLINGIGEFMRNIMEVFE